MAKQRKEFNEAAKKAANGRKLIIRISVFEPVEKDEHSLLIEGEESSKEEIQGALLKVCQHFGMVCLPKEAIAGAVIVRGKKVDTNNS